MTNTPNRNQTDDVTRDESKNQFGNKPEKNNQVNNPAQGTQAQGGQYNQGSQSSQPKDKSNFDTTQTKGSDSYSSGTGTAGQQGNAKNTDKVSSGNR